MSRNTKVWAVRFAIIASLCSATWSIVCPVGYGKVGLAKGIQYSMIWYRYCGTQVEYCYRMGTTDPDQISKLYPEHDWHDTSEFYSTFYVLQCGGDFGFDEEAGCGKTKKSDLYSNTHPNEKLGGRERLPDFTTDYCCKDDMCTSAGRSVSPGVFASMALVLASVILTASSSGLF